jgi:hypothetical protein
VVAMLSHHRVPETSLKLVRFPALTHVLPPIWTSRFCP